MRGRPVTLAPSKLIVPRVAGVSRRIIRPIVVLPLPLSPISETTWPASTSKLTSRTAGRSVPPKVPTL